MPLGRGGGGGGAARTHKDQLSVKPDRHLCVCLQDACCFSHSSPALKRSHEDGATFDSDALRGRHSQGLREGKWDLPHQLSYKKWC